MWQVGVDEERTHERLKALLGPYPIDKNGRARPVSLRVGNVKNNDPSLTEPLARAS
jgi:putative SOS response-associated peptidase YedK